MREHVSSERQFAQDFVELQGALTEIRDRVSV